jgi:hypothetical protein
MRLEDLRNPLPDIKKAYSPNFSNTTNELQKLSRDEKGAAMLSESGLLKWLLPLLLPDYSDTVVPDLFDFDRPTADDDMLPLPWGDGQYPDYDPDGGPSIDQPDRPVYTPPVRDLDFGTFDGGLSSPSVGAPTG